MLLYERINQILKQKNIKKKDFAAKFLEFEPTLKSTGETPSMPTIYNYLNGTREIKADLIPAMAKALDISEQELFMDDETYTDKFKKIINRADDIGDIKRGKILRLIDLCEYAPDPLIDKVVEILENNKNMVLNQIRMMR